MSLRKTTISIICATFVVMLGLFWAISREVVLRGFTELESQTVRRDLDRVGQALAAEIGRIDKLTLDWAPWDDAYQFMLDGNESFVTVNLVPSVLRDQELDALAFFALDGRLVWGQGYDREAGAFAPLPEGAAAAARKILAAAPATALTGRSGLVHLPGGTLLASFQPVLTSLGKGRPRGLLLMGRLIDARLTAQLAEQTRLDLTFLPLSGGANGADATVVGQLTAGGPPLIRAVSRNVIAGFELLADMDGAPVMALKAATGREAYAQGLKTVRSAVLALALAGLVCSLVLLALFERQITEPLRRLGRQVAHIGESDDLSLRIHAAGISELGQLAGEFNQALDEIEKGRARLSDQLVAITEQEAFLAGLFDSIQAGIMLIDPADHRVVEVNSFALGVMGRRREEVVGRTCHGVTCPAEIGRCPMTDLGQRLDVSEREVLHRDGSRVPILKSATTIRRGGQELLLESFIDISRLHETQQALRRAHDELEETVARRTGELEAANRELKELDRQKSTFLSSASHELRTPLTSVLGFAKLMHKVFTRSFMPLTANDPVLAVKAREFAGNFEIIAHEGERLTRLLNDLLDLNKIESGRMVWRDAPLNLSDFLDHTAKAAKGLFNDASPVRLEADIPADLGECVIDRDRLEQVLFNLLHNAAKFTSQGQVLLAGRADNGGVEIRVADTGPGIPAAERIRIFDKFYQSVEREVLPGKPLGTGLGLAICRQIVEHYGGQVRVESEPGRGSAFIVRLPRTGPHAAA